MASVDIFVQPRAVVFALHAIRQISRRSASLQRVSDFMDVSDPDILFHRDFARLCSECAQIQPYDALSGILQGYNHGYSSLVAGTFNMLRRGNSCVFNRLSYIQMAAQKIHTLHLGAYVGRKGNFGRK